MSDNIHELVSHLQQPFRATFKKIKATNYHKNNRKRISFAGQKFENQGPGKARYMAQTPIFGGGRPVTRHEQDQ